MTVPAQVLAAVRSIPYPRQEPDMTTVDKTTASDAEFRTRIAAFEAAEEPAEIVVERERLERVTEALLITVLGTDDRDFLTGCDLPADEIARLIVEYGAAAAIAAMPTHPAEAAVKRVEALAERLGDESREFYYDNRHTHENGISYVGGVSDAMEQIADRILAALAPPDTQSANVNR